MKIFGLEIKKIEKKDMPRKRKQLFSIDSEVTDKCREYMLGNLKNSPFSMKEKQSYLHYDGMRIAHGKIYFMWKGEAMVSKDIVGPQTCDPLEICGILGKQRVNLT